MYSQQATFNLLGRTSGVPEVGFFIKMHGTSLTPEFSPPRGSAELDSLIHAYIPGPSSLSEKMSFIMLEFFQHRLENNATEKFFKITNTMLSPQSDVYSSTNSPIALDAAWNFDQLSQSSAFHMPVLTASQISCASQIVSAPQILSVSPSAPRKLSASPQASSSSTYTPSPSRSTTSTPRIPGMTILSRDGQDITDVASRGSKTREQREHAHMMRKLGACASCKRKKIKCDPSHVSAAASSASAPCSAASAHPRVGSAIRKTAARRVTGGALSASASTSGASVGAGESLTPAPTPALSSFSSSPTTAPPAIPVAPMDTSQSILPSPPDQPADFEMVLLPPTDDELDQILNGDWPSMDLFDANVDFMALLQSQTIESQPQLQPQPPQAQPQPQQEAATLPFDVSLNDAAFCALDYTDFDLYSSTSSPVSVDDQMVRMLSASPNNPSVGAPDAGVPIDSPHHHDHHHPHQDHDHGGAQSQDFAAAFVSPQQLSTAFAPAATDLSAGLDLPLGQLPVDFGLPFSAGESFTDVPVQAVASWGALSSTPASSSALPAFPVSSVVAHMSGSQSSRDMPLETQQLLDGSTLQSQLPLSLLFLPDGEPLPQSNAVVVDHNALRDVNVGVGVGVDFNPGNNAPGHVAPRVRHVPDVSHRVAPALTAARREVTRTRRVHTAQSESGIYRHSTTTSNRSLLEAQDTLPGDVQLSVAVVNSRGAPGHRLPTIQGGRICHVTAENSSAGTPAIHVDAVIRSTPQDIITSSATVADLQPHGSSAMETGIFSAIETSRNTTANIRPRINQDAPAGIPHVVVVDTPRLPHTTPRPQEWPDRSIYALLLSPVFSSSTGHVLAEQNANSRALQNSEHNHTRPQHAGVVVNTATCITSPRGSSAGHALSTVVSAVKSCLSYILCGYITLLFLASVRSEWLLVLGQLAAVSALAGIQPLLKKQAGWMNSSLKGVEKQVNSFELFSFSFSFPVSF